MDGSMTLRRTSRRTLSLLASVGLLGGMFAIGSGTALAIGPLSNGSFETGTDPGSFTQLAPGDTNITDWTVSSGSIDYIGTYWTASAGSRSVDLSGSDAGAISQSFATTAGVAYNVTFDLSGNPAGAPALKTLNVDAGGAPTPYSYDTAAAGNTLTDMKWAAQTYSFVATAATTTLTFTSTTAGAFGPALDNVAVAAAALTCTPYSGSPTASVNFATGGASTTATGTYQPGDYFQCTSTAAGTPGSWSVVHGQVSPIALTSTFAYILVGDGTNPATASLTYTATNGTSATVNFNLLPLSVAISGPATQTVGATPLATATNAIGDGLGALGSNHQNITYSLSSSTPTATGTCTAAPGTAALPATASPATSTLTGTSPGVCTATFTYTVSTVGPSAGFSTPFTVTASAAVTFRYATPATKDACKDGGWKHLTDNQGHAFKNQGDCVSYVATKGKNLGDGTP